MKSCKIPFADALLLLWKKVLDRRAAVQEIAYHFDLVHLCHGLDDPLNNEGLELGKSIKKWC